MSKKKIPLACGEIDNTTQEKDTEQQTADQYLISVLKDKVKLSGLETRIAKKLREQKNQHFQLENEVQRLSRDLKRAQVLLTEVRVRVDENSRLLVEAEGERRGIKTKG